MKYVYFVSYAAMGIFGMSMYETDAPITTWLDAVNVKADIDRRNKIDCVVTNFVLLRTEGEPTCDKCAELQAQIEAMLEAVEDARNDIHFESDGIHFEHPLEALARIRNAGGQP